MKEHIIRLRAEICQRPALLRGHRAKVALLATEKLQGYEIKLTGYQIIRRDLRKNGRALSLAYAFARGRAYATVERNPKPLSQWNLTVLARDISKLLEESVTKEAIVAWMTPVVPAEVAAA